MLIVAYCVVVGLRQQHLLGIVMGTSLHAISYWLWRQKKYILAHPPSHPPAHLKQPIPPPVPMPSFNSTLMPNSVRNVIIGLVLNSLRFKVF